jgi:RNA polymerase sigma-70 factor (ECF subfamily)
MSRASAFDAAMSPAHASRGAQGAPARDTAILPPPRDIQQVTIPEFMREPAPRSEAAEDGPAVRPGRISPAEFALAFEGAARVLHTLAVAELRDRSHAPDVLQEAALIGLQKLDQFEAGTSVRAWLGRIVMFVARNHARRDRRRRTHPVDPQTLDEAHAACAASGVGESVARALLDADGGQFDDELRAALSELSPVARACLLLRAVLDLEYKQIADWLEIPVGTAVSHVHRARGRLRARLPDRALPARKP